MLQHLLHSYNNIYHRTIGMAPVKVNWINQEEVWQWLHGNLGRRKNVKVICNYSIYMYICIYVYIYIYITTFCLIFVLFILPHRVLLYTFVNMPGIYQEVASSKSPPYVCVLVTLKTKLSLLHCGFSHLTTHEHSCWSFRPQLTHVA